MIITLCDACKKQIYPTDDYVTVSGEYSNSIPSETGNYHFHLKCWCDFTRFEGGIIKLEGDDAL